MRCRVERSKCRQAISSSRRLERVRWPDARFFGIAHVAFANAAEALGGEGTEPPSSKAYRYPLRSGDLLAKP
jgi:hypothetical protein